jgi:hypothetical protein
VQAEPERAREVARSSYITIEGKRHLWRDILKLRREQNNAEARAKQPTLFPLIEDSRPSVEQTASLRYLEPTLFSRN